MKNISIIIPLFNEEESLPELAHWIEKVMVENNFSYEIIFVDDGSKDDSWKVVENLAQQNQNIRGIKFRRNYGKSAALNEGFGTSSGDVVITMDADLQDSPDEIPVLYKMIKVDGFELVSGWKKKRYDPITKTIPTKLFNWATRKMSGVYLHDFNCGLKAYNSEVVKNIEIYGEMHRYIPVIAKWSGFTKIGEKVVQHQPRKYGQTKFGIERFINGFLDLLSISFLSVFGKKPMHLFGTLGALSFALGTVISLYLSYLKIVHGEPLSNRPMLLFAAVLMIIGVQLFIFGLLAELISRSTRGSNSKIDYQIAKKIT